MLFIFCHPFRVRGRRATAGRSWLISTYCPAFVIFNRTTLIVRSPTLRVLALAVASPQASKLSTISGVKPRARSTPSVMPRRSPALISISSARRHSALSGILSIATGLTLVGDREPPQAVFRIKTLSEKVIAISRPIRDDQIKRRNVRNYIVLIDACARAPNLLGEVPHPWRGKSPIRVPQTP